jgi:hypothetical protein
MSCNDNSKITLKRGATLSWLLTYADSDGAAINLNSYTITSQIKTLSGVLVANLTPTLLNQTTDTGKFTLTYIGDTIDLPVGSLVFDVRFVTGGVVTYTQSATLSVVNGVTDA